ncbi:MAG: T9SS type A sorting domain-containing protein [Flavobacterium sp.]|nr:MAG: T9SS type A sorting domain-containing protein [Flavobacterium sp.]
MKTKLLLLLLLANFSFYAQTNLVPNGSLETWASGVPQNWSVSNSVTQSLDASGGTYSAKLSYTTVSPKIIASVPLKAGATYTIKYKYKYLSSNYGGDHPISLKISATGSASSISSSVFATNNLWTEKETTFTPDSDLSYDLSISSFSFDSQAFDFLIDDVTVYDDNESLQYTDIPDLNFEKRLIALGIDQDGENGKVLTSSIASVTELNISHKSIADMTGIQDFVALTILECYGNELTTLDVSKNVNLIALSCGENKLTSLDLSKNLALQELSFSYNQLTTIDLSKNLALTSLACYSNKLTNLDVSHNLALKSLECQTNQLTTIDVSKNLALGTLGVSSNKLTDLDVSANLDLIDLYCTENFLTNLDISKNTLLKTLDCTHNQLKCILVSNVDHAYTSWNNYKDKSAIFTKDCDAATAIPDLNFERKLISLGIDTGTPDGQVLTANIVSLTSLNVSVSSITDMTGIQDFKALTSLNCNQNSLKELNVSKNTALTILHCNYNQIAALDVSNNLALIELICYANKLTSLDVKKNTALTKLDSGSNQYTTLDVSSNTALTFLGCNTSQLTSIDVSKNTALKLLDCRENKITNLDISKLTALTELYCESNQLKDLDVSKNKSLELINCSKNQLTTLDISAHPAAIGLYANSNQLTSLNLKNGNNVNFQLLYLNLTNNPNLSCIQVDDKVYSDANWSTKKDATASYETTCTSYYTEIPDSNFEKKLIDLGIDTDGLNGKVTIANIEKVTYLDLSNSNISDLTGIEKFTALTYLDCNYNNLSTIDVSKNKLLTKLSLHDNKLTSLDVSANTELYNLTFSMNQISTIDLSHNTKVHYVGADRNKLSNIDLTANPEIEILYCGDNNLTTLNVSNLPNLLQLNCTYTTISAIDVTSNPKLEMLYFNDSKLKTLDLSKNPLLKNLNVSDNELTTLDLSHNPLLEIVFIEFNPLTSLNVQNGNNKNFILPSETAKKAASGIATSFLNNLQLKCIKVDDAAYSNANWSKIKESTTTYSETCTLGIEDNVFDKVSLYPNPTKGELNIQKVSLEKATVYNSLGQLVKTFTLDSSNVNNTINLSGLPKGIYYVYLINQDAASAKKVIVE